jgi:hypothetical protein
MAWPEDETEQTGRAPRPRRGDPNIKPVRLALEPEEWRKLRFWAAQDATTVERVVMQIVRRALDARPRRTA